MILLILSFIGGFQTNIITPIYIPILFKSSAQIVINPTSTPTPTPTPTLTPVPTPTQTPTATPTKQVTDLLNPGKCIAGTYANEADLDKLDLSCFYTWGPEKPHWYDWSDHSYTWYPMIRDNDVGHPDADDVLNGKRRLDHQGIVMLFNECDAPIGSEQCELTALEAATYTKLLQAKFPGVKWVTPAVHNWGSSGWLSNYLNFCDGCEFHAINIHWYDTTCTLGEFQNYVNRFRSYGLPIWVTEIACLDEGYPAKLTAMKQYWQFAKDDPQIVGIFPWSLKIGPLYGDFVWVDYVDINSGELTPLGEWYKEVEW